MLILALEVDVAVVRAAVLDVTPSLPIGATACVEYTLDKPTPEASEAPADRVWSAVGAAARSVAQATEGIEGVGLCTATPGLVVLDDRDRPAAGIRLPDDRRARTAARQVQADVGADLLAETGNIPLPGLVSALSFRQMLEDDPYLIREVRRYLHLNGWLALHLTGNAAFDPAGASLTGFYGTNSNSDWSPRWCEYFEIDPVWLPPVIDGAATVGTIRSAVAHELGIPAGLPLKLGTDAISLMLHAVDFKPGSLFHDLSDPQRLVIRVETPRADGRRLVSRFGLGEGCLETVFNPVGPGSLRWLHALCFRDQSDEEFRLRTIPQAPATASRVTFDPPYLTGDSLGIVAARAAFRDLTPATDRMELLAAMLTEMRNRHEKAMGLLGWDRSARRIYVRGGDAEFALGLLKYEKDLDFHFVQPTPLTAIASLFSQ
jgi:xylulokinase